MSQSGGTDQNTVEQIVQQELRRLLAGSYGGQSSPQGTGAQAAQGGQAAPQMQQPQQQGQQMQPQQGQQMQQPQQGQQMQQQGQQPGGTAQQTAAPSPAQMGQAQGGTLQSMSQSQVGSDSGQQAQPGDVASALRMLAQAIEGGQLQSLGQDAAQGSGQGQAGGMLRQQQPGTMASSVGGIFRRAIQSRSGAGGSSGSQSRQKKISPIAKLSQQAQMKAGVGLSAQSQAALIAQAQQEFAQELSVNLSRLRQVISESQEIAKRMEKVLGSGNAQGGQSGSTS